MDGSIKGVGKFHKTSIFPCGIFQCKKDVNRKLGDKNYDLYRLALKSTAKRLYPNYCNTDVTMQKEWVVYDRKCKNEVISNLSTEEYNALFDRIENDEQLQTLLMLDAVKDINGKKTLTVRTEELPIEIMSTMGKRKLQLI